MDDIYTGQIKATILDAKYNPVESSLLSMDSKDGRYLLRCMANRAHASGRKLLTEPVSPAKN
ncbi:MAG: hypothetical protein AB7E51_06650 [Pseudodesulfovibrio sp.]|uniref:hypothetical protein n=1 Tax=Pseudodesulfovibrio sp. TaxID=2035812 RepID=UPI003D0F2E0E